MLTKLYVRARSYLIADDGASAVEYGLLVAGIAVLIIAAVFLLGGNLRDMFNDIADRIGGAG
jgi:pilus assembly protein Flp/PilA